MSLCPTVQRFTVGIEHPVFHLSPRSNLEVQKRKQLTFNAEHSTRNAQWVLSPRSTFHVTRCALDVGRWTLGVQRLRKPDGLEDGGADLTPP